MCPLKVRLTTFAEATAVKKPDTTMARLRVLAATLTAKLAKVVISIFVIFVV